MVLISLTGIPVAWLSLCQTTVCKPVPGYRVTHDAFKADFSSDLSGELVIDGKKWAH